MSALAVLVTFLAMTRVRAAALADVKAACVPATAPSGGPFYLYEYTFQPCVQEAGPNGPCTTIDVNITTQDTVRQDYFSCTGIRKTQSTNQGKIASADYAPNKAFFQIQNAGGTQQRPADLNFTRQCDSSYYVIPSNRTTNTALSGRSACVAPQKPITITCPFNGNGANITVKVDLSCHGTIAFATLT